VCTIRTVSVAITVGFYAGEVAQWHNG